MFYRRLTDLVRTGPPESEEGLDWPSSVSAQVASAGFHLFAFC